MSILLKHMTDSLLTSSNSLTDSRSSIKGVKIQKYEPYVKLNETIRWALNETNRIIEGNKDEKPYTKEDEDEIKDIFKKKFRLRANTIATEKQIDAFLEEVDYFFKYEEDKDIITNLEVISKGFSAETAVLKASGGKKSKTSKMSKKRKYSKKRKTMYKRK
jgi:hypothetical protein